MSSLLALASAAVFGVADFVGGRASARQPVLRVTLVSNLVGLLVAILLSFIAPTEWSTDAVVWGALGGAGGLVGLLLLYHGLATGPNRLVSPVAAVVSVIVPVAVGLASGERLETIAIIGLALTPIAVWMIADGAWQLGGERRSLLIATGAGLGFGTFFACLAQTPDDAGAAPLVGARATSAAILVVAVLATRSLRTGRMPLAALAIAAAAGALDMFANGLFLWAVQDGDLAIVGALVSLFPATTVLLAVVVLHERVRARQLAGIALGLLAAALLS